MIIFSFLSISLIVIGVTIVTFEFIGDRRCIILIDYLKLFKKIFIACVNGLNDFHDDLKYYEEDIVFIGYLLFGSILMIAFEFDLDVYFNIDTNLIAIFLLCYWTGGFIMGVLASKIASLEIPLFIFFVFVTCPVFLFFYLVLFIIKFLSLLAKFSLLLTEDIVKASKLFLLMGLVCILSGFLIYLGGYLLFNDIFRAFMSILSTN